jgi:diadenosine tetraphosphate (Ap4A) HIT family hydrolase
LSKCAYCDVPAEEAWISTELAVALPHPHPLTACHMVVAPRRHVRAFYDLDVQEQRILWELVTEIRNRISAVLVVKGFEVGFVDGPTSDAHAYVQVIPRTDGDDLELPHDVEWVTEAF